MTPSRKRRWPVVLGLTLVGTIALVALLAPVLAPNGASEMFPDRAYAPPMRVRVFHEGSLRAPFVYRQVLADRLMREYREDTSAPVPLEWFANGRVVSSGDATTPLLLLGGDALGRDIFSRLLTGARLSLGVTLAGALGALFIGTLVGGLAGSAGGGTDSALMFVTDFLLALPGAYLVLVLRGFLPLVLSQGVVFGLLAALFAFAAWPHAARGVRAIVAVERRRDYAEAARALGAGRFRLAAHLMPAARGFLAVEAVLLVPALLVAETTVSYLGLGFTDANPSWGTMLIDAASLNAMRQAPWMLAPAAALFLVVLGVQLVASTPASRQTLLVGKAPWPSGGTAEPLK